MLIGEGSVIAYKGTSDLPIEFWKMRGYGFPDVVRNLKVFIVMEPTTVEPFKDKERMTYNFYARDIVDALVYFNKPFAGRDGLKYCKNISPQESNKLIDDVVKGKFDRFVAFDYETTGLKPYREGHRIISCALCTSPTSSYAFMVNNTNKQHLKKFLTSDVPKAAANNTFEYLWTKFIFGVDINNLIYDCVLGKHLLDNRKGVVSVKIQGFLNYGIYGYEKALDSFKESDEEEKDKYGVNGYNTMTKVPEDELLTYNAVDSLLEYWITEDSMPQLFL